jgi:hypothetical protein
VTLSTRFASFIEIDRSAKRDDRVTMSQQNVLGCVTKTFASLLDKKGSGKCAFLIDYLNASHVSRNKISKTFSDVCPMIQ